jgi:protein-serine/threonine kinase
MGRRSRRQAHKKKQYRLCSPYVKSRTRDRGPQGSSFSCPVYPSRPFDDPQQMLKHPNIVRLYDVIETDKYIGIILDYASGGELFDHILAHRYLKEKDACRLFAQLISGVWYIHERKIVHRDLKLENLLLDRNRNVIITDFGFANRFEHRSDDLMQTSCGSPCYAAPELVISEGAYVGSAVDIWSCGVILYAMLAGYLPFDDDPANPDGDNINLLYKYIVNTPLSFPDYISPEARDLLSIMLQPDPQRRADLSLVMQHPWLAPYAYLFDKTIEDLEASAIESHRAKRQAYQRQMRNAAQATATDHNKVARSQSAKNDVFPHASVAVAPRSHSHAPRTRRCMKRLLTSPRRLRRSRRHAADIIPRL